MEVLDEISKNVISKQYIFYDCLSIPEMISFVSSVSSRSLPFPTAIISLVGTVLEYPLAGSLLPLVTQYLYSKYQEAREAIYGTAKI